MDVIACEMSFNTVRKEAMRFSATHSCHVAEHQLSVMRACTNWSASLAVEESRLFTVEHHDEQVRQRAADFRRHDHVLSIFPRVREGEAVVGEVMIESAHVRVCLSHVSQFVIPVEFEHTLRTHHCPVAVVRVQDRLFVSSRDRNGNGEITWTSAVRKRKQTRVISCFNRMRRKLLPFRMIIGQGEVRCVASV